MTRHAFGSLPKETPYRCHYCQAPFLGYPGLRTVPQWPLPETTTELEAVSTCGDPRCMFGEIRRQDAAVNAILQGRRTTE